MSTTQRERRKVILNMEFYSTGKDLIFWRWMDHALR